jgi:hypothetical protein
MVTDEAFDTFSNKILQFNGLFISLVVIIFTLFKKESRVIQECLRLVEAFLWMKISNFMLYFK